MIIRFPSCLDSHPKMIFCLKTWKTGILFILEVRSNAWTKMIYYNCPLQADLFFLYKFNFKDTDNSLDSIRRKATIFILFTLSKIFRHLSAVLHLRWIYCALIAVHVITRVLHNDIRTAKINFLLLVIPQRMIMIQSSAEVV